MAIHSSVLAWSERLNLSGLDLGGQPRAGLCSQQNNLEPEQCGQGGYTRRERVSHTPAACSFPGENARSGEALGEARPGQSSLSAGALRYRILRAGNLLS